MAYRYQDSWNDEQPVIQVHCERKLGKYIGLESLVRRCSLDTYCDAEFVTLSYCGCFLVFKSTEDADKVRKFIDGLRSMWNDMARQANAHERDPGLYMFGSVSGVGPRKGKKGKITIAYGVRQETYKKLEDADCLAYQKAVKGSQRVLPF